MKTHIITTLLILTCVGFAAAGEGSKFQPDPANRQTPVVSHQCEETSAAKSTSRSPRALTGHKTALLVPCAQHTKLSGYVASDWTLHRNHQ